MKFLKERTFNVDIVFVIVGLLFVTVALVTGFTYVRNKASFLEMVRGNFSKEALSVIDKTSDYMLGAQTLAEISTVVLEDPDVQLGLDTKLEAFLLKVVMEQGQVDLFYYGDEQGDFLQAAKLGDVIYTKYIHRTPAGAVTLFHYFDETLTLDRTETLRDDKYDPRARPWYEGAKETDARYWTEPYIFHENGKPGITVACPIHREDATLKGVVAADITLSGLSGFLKQIDIGANGISFILDASGRLVAYPEPDRMVTIENGAMRNLKPQELKIPRVTQAVRAYEDSQQRMFTYETDGDRHLAYFTPFPDAFGKRWTMAIIAPEEDFLGPLKDTLKATLLRSAILLIVAIFAAIVLARQISRPFELLTDEVLEVKDLNLETKHEIKSHIREIRSMNGAIAAMKKSLEAFRLYVPATLVRKLIASGEDIRIGGKDRELTLFFSDIAGFTPITESLSPSDLMVQLSEYFDRISVIIADEQGTLDKFIGDAVMAFWGAPIANDEHAVLACRAALRCRDGIADLNREWEEQGKQVFETRFGLHTGYVTVGNMGSRHRMNYSVIGDAVNLASRLEGVNKLYGTSIIISKGTHRYVQNHFICRVLDQIAVKGKSQSTTIYELVAERGAEGADALDALAEGFNRAYALYLDRRWSEAKGALESLRDDHPDDEVVGLYLARCERYMGSEPDEDWTGITRLDHK